MSNICTSEEIHSNSPLDVLDFSMIEGGTNPSKSLSRNSDSSDDDTIEVSRKCVESNKLNVPTFASDDAKVQPEESPISHHRSKTYKCPFCSYKSTRSCNLTSHLKTHYLELPHADPTCTYCGTLNNYKIDCMSINLENQGHPCLQCSTVSSSVEDALKHLKSHLDESTCICTHSQMNDPDLISNRPKSKKKKYLKKSTIIKEPKTIKCPTCPYVTHHPQNLKCHILTHTQEKLHPCTICSYNAPNVSRLKVHMKTHTGERPHKCPHCSYKAAQKSTLQNHLKTHTGEKPFTCMYCSYKCAIQTNLNSHLKTHTGERPFSCPHCSYSATQSNALKCHLRIHTGEKPFSCPQCPYKSAALGNLRSHSLTHCQNF